MGFTLFAAPAANAQTTYYWSGNGTTQGGAGTWNTTDPRWGVAPAGPFGTAWVNGTDTAVFGGTAGTVSLGESITVGGLTFYVTGYNITTGPNALIFGGTNNTIALYNNVTAATITGTLGASSANMTFTAQNSLVNHTLTFTSASANSWSGSTTINAGLTLATTTTSGNINQVLNSTSGITINGGAIQFNRATNAQLNAISDTAPITVNGGGTFGATSADAGGASAIENIGVVTVNSGQMNFNWTNGASSGAQIILSGLTRNGTSALTFSGALATTGRWGVTGSGTTTGGEIIGPWATTGGASGINAQNDYAVYSGGFVAAANIAASDQSSWTTTYAATSNYTLNMVNVIAAANGRLTASRNINALRGNTNSVAPSVVDAGTDYITMAGNTLLDGDVVVSRNTTGGQLSPGRAYYVINAGVAGAGTFQVSATPGGTAVNLTTTVAGFISGGLSLNGNTLGTYGIMAGASDPLAIGGGTGSSVTLPTTASGNLYVTNGNASVWIDAPITDNGAGVLTLVKGGTSGNGSGNVTLSGNNTYTGGTVVNSGALVLSGTNTFLTGSAGADVINGGSITYSTLASWGGTGRDVTFNGTGTLTSTVGSYVGATLTSNAGANAVIVNPSSGTGGLTFATTTGSGNVLYSAGTNRILNIGNASGLTGNLQARLTGNANFTTGTTIQFSNIGDGVGSSIQFVGGTSDSNQAMTVAYNGSTALVFANRQIQILDRLASNWELRDNIIANNSTDAAHTWTINTDLLYTGGRANTGAQSGRRFVLSGSNTGSNAFNGVISNGQNSNGLVLEKTGTGTWFVTGANTYTGATLVTAGILNVTTLANGGSPSSIGASSNAAANLVFGTGARLRYTGTGHTTDRSFIINGTAAGHNAILDASGTGAINFTNTATPGYGTTNQTRTLTLSGSNTGANTLAANLTNNGTGALSINKLSPGNWILSGNNTYTGATTISAGTLLVNGVHNPTAAAPAYTVAATATLGGSGTIVPAVSIAANATLTGGDPFVPSMNILSFGAGFSTVAGSNIAVRLFSASPDNVSPSSINDPTSNSFLKVAAGTTTIDTGTVFVLSGVAALDGSTPLQYRIATGTGDQTGLGITNPVQFDTTGLTNGNLYTYSITGDNSNGGNVYLNMTPVPIPEPVSLGLIAVAGLGLGRFIRRRRTGSGNPCN